MFLHTTEVVPLDNYRLQLRFNNGVSGVVSLKNELWGEVFEPLNDPDLFASARQCDSARTVVWANGADMAPEHLLELMQQSAVQQDRIS
jgi:hypothetical protein